MPGTLFQFQNGSIKRFAKKKLNVVNILFQFQNGSIKSHVFCFPAFVVLCFNSKMVRLKVDSEIKGYELQSSFNSKMVRLKGVNPLSLNAFSLSFNSKMVRLKGTQE